LRRIVPGNADEPGDGEKNPAEDGLQILRKPGHVRPVVKPPIMALSNAAAPESDEHGADIERQMQAIASAARDCAKNVGFFSICGISTRPAVSGCSFLAPAFWPSASAGAVMMTAVSKSLAFAPPT